MGEAISVLLADDNAIVREGVRAMLAAEPDMDIVGVAYDRDSLISAAVELAPQVVVTDIRMPPTFQGEGIDAAHRLRKLNPGTGVVVLSQYDEPGFAVRLLGPGAAGLAYLLKDSVASGDQLATAVRQVASGGSMIDPRIADALVQPVTDEGDLTPADEDLLHMVAAGRPIKAIAAARGVSPATASDDVERLFLKISTSASTGAAGSLRRLRRLHQAIVESQELGETLSRLLPAGVGDKLRRDGGMEIGDVEEFDATIVMSDVRGYSAIAERSDVGVLARQMSTHRAEMNGVVHDAGGTVMQYNGDAVLAVFGAPGAAEDHADQAVRAALSMIEHQATVNQLWALQGLPAFGLGIGVSSGRIGAALLGSAERLEYTVFGDTVNLAQRLQDLARPAGRIVLSDAAYAILRRPVEARRLGPVTLKGREAPVVTYVIETTDAAASDGG